MLLNHRLHNTNHSHIVYCFGPTPMWCHLVCCSCGIVRSSAAHAHCIDMHDTLHPGGICLFKMGMSYTAFLVFVSHFSLSILVASFKNLLLRKIQLLTGKHNVLLIWLLFSWIQSSEVPRLFHQTMLLE